MKFSFSIASFLVSIAAFDAVVTNGEVTGLQNIVQTASQAGAFSTLVSALSAANLDGALSGEGSFTVFAPSNQAFAELPDGLLDCLLKDENKSELQSVLLSHVAPVKVLSSQLSSGQEIQTLLDGSSLTVNIGDGGVKINDSTVIVADIPATNGVIHGINQVQVPPSFDVPKFLEECSSEDDIPTDDIPTTAVKSGNLNTLVTALDAADLVGAVSEPGPFTVFAPSDVAFSKLPEGVLSCLLEPSNKQTLTDVLLYHVAPAQVSSSDLSDGQQIPTLLQNAGVTVGITPNDNTVTINDSTVQKADLLATNGVIHLIDSVMVPEGSLDDLDCSPDSSVGCTDNAFFEFIYTNKKGRSFNKGGCEFVARKRKKRCRKIIDGKKVRKDCPIACRVKKLTKNFC